MIQSVDLRNFKCFERERIPLGAITLATGLNSSGKSSLLQGLLLLRQSHAQGLLQTGKLALNGDLVQIGAGYDVFYEDAEGGDVVSLGLAWKDGVTASWEFSYDRESDVLTNHAAQVPAEVFQRPPIGGEVHYLSAERIGPRAVFRMADYAVEHQRQLGHRGEYAGHFLSHFGRSRVETAALHHPEAASDQLEAQVEAWLGEVSPGVRLDIKEHREMDAVQLRFAFDGPHGRTSGYRPTNVGFGLTYTLSIIVATLTARPGSLLIVENPEAHVHPRGQVRLTQLMALAARAGVQVLVETHSDHVLNGLRLAVHGGQLSPEAVCLHYFERRVTRERTYHTVISPRMDAEGRIEPWPQGFFDEWELALERLLEPRGSQS